MKNLSELKSRLKNELPSGGISHVIKSLKGLLPESAAKYNLLLELESEHKEIKLKFIEGILAHEEVSRITAGIRLRLMKLIDSLEKDDFDRNTRKSNLSPDQKIRKGHVLYKIPSTMQLWEETRCLIRIAFDKAMLLEDLDIDEHTQVRTDVRISDYMKVEIIDPSPNSVFEIRTTSEGVQFIDQDDFTEWRFYVKPLQSGKHVLELKVTVMLVIDGETRVRERTLEESVVIITEQVPEESNENFKETPEAFVLPAAMETNMPTSSGFRLPKSVKTIAFSLLALMVASTATFAFTPPVERAWINAHYIQGGLFEDANAYEEFIVKHPKSKHVEQATFEKATIKKTPEAFKEYIEKFPKGTYIEKVSWKVATLSQQPEAYIEYIRKFPEQKARVEKAKVEVKKLEPTLFKEIQKGENIQNITRYLDIYPAGKFKKEVLEKIDNPNIWKDTAVVQKNIKEKITSVDLSASLWNHVSQRNTKEAYQNYLKRFPTGKYAKIAKDSLMMQKPKPSSSVKKPASSTKKESTLKEKRKTRTDERKKIKEEKQSKLPANNKKMEPIIEDETNIDQLKSTEKVGQNDSIEKKKSELITPKKTEVIKVIKGSFTDTRNGTVYPTLKIGIQTWMAKNLNIEVEDSWCYDGKTNCQKYGRLYTWEAAKKACPKGWHLPSDDEWWTIASYYGKAYNTFEGQEENDNSVAGKAAYKALMKGGDSGFSALLGGSRGSDGDFYDLGKYGNYWSSSEKSSSDAWYYYFRSYNEDLYRYGLNKSVGFSCRCFQD